MAENIATIDESRVQKIEEIYIQYISKIMDQKKRDLARGACIMDIYPQISVDVQALIKWRRKERYKAGMRT